MSSLEHLHILNLVDNLSENLIAYFGARKIKIIQKDEGESYSEIDYIIVAHEQDIQETAQFYNVLENDIKLICLSRIVNTKQFLLSNGRLSLKGINESLITSILDTFFRKEKTLHISDKEEFDSNSTGVIRITNPMIVGEAIDQITMHAFDNDFNIVTVRTYIDHIIYYFTYLKQAGLSGIPVEIEYAFNERDFHLNIFGTVRNFTSEYILDSFGDVNNEDPLRFLLGIASQATSFFDVSYFEDASKLSFHAVWNKEKNQDAHALSFYHIESKTQVFENVNKRIRNFELNNNQANLADKNLPGGLLDLLKSNVGDTLFADEPEKANNLLAFIVGAFEDRYPENQIEDITLDQLSHIIRDYPDEEFVQSIKEADKEQLLQKLKKSNVLSAYDEEVDRVRATLSDDEEHKTVLKETLNEDVAQKVSGQIDEEDLKNILSGANEEDYKRKIGGIDEDGDFKKVVKGLKDEDKKEFIRKFSSSIKEKASQFDFSSTTLKSSDFKEKIADMAVKSLAGVKDTDSKQARVKNFIKNSNIQNKLTAKMDQFTEKFNNGEFSSSDFETFINEELESVISNSLSDQVEVEKYSKNEKEELNQQIKFEKKFKESLSERVDSLELSDDDKNSKLFSQEGVKSDETQQIIKASMKEALDSEIDFVSASREEIASKEEQIVNRISGTFDKDKGDVKKIISESTKVVKEKEIQTVVDNLFKANEAQETKSGTLEDSALLARLSEAESKNKYLSSELKKLELKLNTNEEASSKINDLNDLAKERADDLFKDQAESGTSDALSVADKSQLLEDIRSGDPLSDEQIQAISNVIEREKVMLQSIKDTEASMKKLTIENSQKETLFKSELLRASKTIKSKDMVISKAKEGMTMLVEKKDREVKNAKKTIEDLNKKLKADDSARLSFELKQMTADKDSLEKSVQLYKNKMENLAKSVSAKKSSSAVDEISDENRKLKTQNLQLEARFTGLEKVKATIDQKYEQARESEAKSATLLKKTQDEMKKLNFDLEKLQADANKPGEESLEEKELKADLSRKDKELDGIKSQNEQLQTKLKEVIEKLAKNSGSSKANGNQSANEVRLEKSVKNMAQELTKIKNDAVEQKKELKKTENELRGFKNKNNLLQKELDRFKNKKSAA